MKKLLRLALTAITLFVCSGAWATDVTFSVTDGANTDYSSYYGKEVNVTLQNRTFTARQWDFAVFPFSASKSQLDATFGEGNYIIEEFKSFADNKITFEAMTTPAVTAGKPVLIAVKSTIANPTFSGVTFANTIATDYFKYTDIESGFEIDAFYFNLDYWKLVHGQSSPNTAYWINKNGTFGNYLNNGEIDYVSSLPGTKAFFYSSSLGTTKLTLAYDAMPSDWSTGGSGGDDVDLTTTEGKIAARKQLTNLPTIYLNVDMPAGETLDSYLYKDRNIDYAPYRYATIQVVATSDTNSPDYIPSFIDDAKDETGKTHLQIKVRGNSTASIGNGKRPYRLKFAKKDKTTGQNFKHDLLGSGYTKRNWTLLANAYDRSLMRNALTYHIGKYVGMDFCPGYKFVDLVINDEYRGTYQVSDHVEVGENRVNVPDEDNDWMMEFATWNNMTEEPCITQNISYMTSIKNPDADDLTEEQVTQLKSDVKDWVNKLGNAWDDNSTTTGWQALNDVESLVKFYIGINLTADYDGFFVVKGYRPVGGKQFWGPLWDKDLSYNNCNQLDETKEKQLVENYDYGTFSDTFKKLHSNPIFIAKAKELIDKLVNDGLYDKLAKHIDDMAADLDESQALNYQKYNITAGEGLETQNKSTDYSTYPKQLKDYMKERIPLVQTLITNLYNEAVGSKKNATYNPENYWYGTGVYEYKNKLADVIVNNRTLKAGTWNTICLPFDASEEKIKTALGCDYELRTHTAMDADGKTMIFGETETKDIVAGFPYLIKLKESNDISNMKFTDVMIVDDANAGNKYNGQSVTFDNQHFFYGTLFTTASNNTNLNLNTDYIFTNDVYAENDVLIKTTSESIKGARAFIRVPEGETALISFEASVAPERKQLTDVPTIYIDYDALDEDVWNTTTTIQVFDKNNMIGGDMASTTLSAKYKGSATTEKPSFRLKFGSKTTFLGTKSGSFKQWVLEANDDDPSMLRNGLTKELGDKLGFAFTPGCQFADVYVNGTYKGTYQITDRVKAEKGRVLVSSKDTDWLLELAESGEVDMTEGTGDLYVAGDDATKPYVIIKNPDKDDYIADETWAPAQQEKVGSFIDKLWADFENNVNQKSFVSWYIASELLGGYKQLSDIYVYKDDTDGKLFFGPLWSNEKSYGNNAKHPIDMSDKETVGSYNGMLFKHAKMEAWQTKLQELWQQQWFKEAVLAKWNTIYGTAKTTDLQSDLTQKVDALAAEIAQTQAFNYKSTDEGGAGWTLTGTYDEAVQAIKTYLTERFEYLDVKFRELAAVEEVEEVNLIDGEPYTNTEEKHVVKVTYKRTFSNTQAGKWQSLYIPFDLNVSDYIDGFDFAKPSFVVSESEDGVTKDNGKIRLYITSVTSGTLEANKPYFIKPKVASTTIFEAEDVTLHAAATTTNVECSTTTSTYSFNGNYADYKSTTPYTFMAMQGGKILWNSSTITLRSYRWYVTVTSKDNASARQNLILIPIDENETTAITGLQNDSTQEVEAFYSPNGMQRLKPTRGINIIRMKDRTTRKVTIK